MSQEWFDNGSNATSTTTTSYGKVYDRLVTPTNVGLSALGRKTTSTLSELEGQLRQEWHNVFVPVRFFGYDLIARPCARYMDSSNSNYPLMIDLNGTRWAGSSPTIPTNSAGYQYNWVYLHNGSQTVPRIYLGGTMVTSKATLGSSYNGQTDRWFWRGNGNIALEEASIDFTHLYTDYNFGSYGTISHVTSETTYRSAFALCKELYDYGIEKGYITGPNDAIKQGLVNQMILENLVIGEPCKYGYEDYAVPSFEEFLDDYAYGAYSYTSTQNQRLACCNTDINCNYYGSYNINTCAAADSYFFNGTALGTTAILGLNGSGNAGDFVFAYDGIEMAIRFNDTYSCGSAKIGTTCMGNSFAYFTIDRHNYLAYVGVFGTSYLNILKSIGRMDANALQHTSSSADHFKGLFKANKKVYLNSTTITLGNASYTLNESGTWTSWSGLGGSGAGLPNPNIATTWYTRLNNLSSYWNGVDISSNPRFPLFILASGTWVICIGVDSSNNFKGIAIEVAYNASTSLAYNSSGASRRFVLVVNENNCDEICRIYGPRMISFLDSLSITN